MPKDEVEAQREGSMLIQKSRPIASLWNNYENNFTLAEYKILDTYLARIDATDPDSREVCFTKGDLERLLDVQRIKGEDLQERLIHLMRNPVRLYPNGKKGKDDTAFEMIMLFEMVKATPYVSGSQLQWNVVLKCTESAKKYFFNIYNQGYIKYRLNCVREITSLYTYIMFMYIEYNRFKRTWTESLDELRNILGCTSETYKAYKHFNDKILKKAQKELNEKTICRFTYEPIKEKRTVIALKFSVEKLPDGIMDASEEPLIEENVIDVQGEEKSVKSNGYIELLAELGDNVTVEQAQEIEALLQTVPASMLPEGSSEKDKFEKYLKLKIAKMQVQEKTNKKPIKSKVKYLVKMIQNDIKQEKEPAGNSNNKLAGNVKTYHNFQERTDNNYTQMILDRFSKKD